MLCTKNVHFTYDNKVDQQNDGVAMGSTLGPVFSGIFMVELENSLVPTLTESVTLWQRFVDDTTTFVENNSIAYVLDQLNSFREQIYFTYEVEHNKKLPFIDVLLVKIANKLDTTVYRNPTITDIYLNWNTHAPTTWKRGTLRTILSRVCLVNEESRTVNNCCSKGEKILKSMNKFSIRVLPSNVKKCTTYSGTKLSSKFQLKDQTKKDHQYNVVYYAKCPEEQYLKDYTGEKVRRLV